jgi:hypothetical protein
LSGKERIDSLTIRYFLQKWRDCLFSACIASSIQQMAKNAAGELEKSLLSPEQDAVEAADAAKAEAFRSKMLTISFGLMLAVGLGNRVRRESLWPTLALPLVGTAV